MQLRLFFVGMSIALLSLLAIGCSKEDSSSRRVLGRWEVIENQGISVPNSFFWFSMNYLEFREDGTVLALVKWPPDVGSDIRLNKTASYSLVGEHQIEFVGACRHQDPCTGVYKTTLKGDKLQIFDTDGILTLMRVGPQGENLPPTIVGPSASPTPVELTKELKPATLTPEPASTPQPTPTQNLPVSKTVEPIVTVMSGDKGQGTWLNYKMDEVFDLVVGDAIWMATSKGVFHFNPANDEITDYTKNLENHTLLNSIAVDHVGHIWVTTGREGLAPGDGYGGSLSEFDGHTWIVHIQKEARTHYAVIYEVGVDDAGHIWSDTAESRLGEFNGQIWKTYPVAGILAMTTDETGQRWFGHDGYGGPTTVLDGKPTYGGVSVFDGESWTRYTDELSDGTVSAIASSNTGQMWFGTLNGINKFDGETWTTYTTADGLANNVVWSIAVDQAGHVWAGHGRAGDGVSKFDGETWTNYTQDDGLASNVVHAIATDEGGHIWFGTDVGLSEFIPGP